MVRFSQHKEMTALAQAAIEDLEADATAIHLNPASRAHPARRERDWRGVSVAIGALVKTMSVPVIVKEVGAGINDIAAQFLDMGRHAVDVAGAGGTNWVRIEAVIKMMQVFMILSLIGGMNTIDCLPR